MKLYLLVLPLLLLSCDSQGPDELATPPDKPAPQPEELVNFFSLKVGNQWTYSIDLFSDGSGYADSLKGIITWSLTDSLKSSSQTSYTISEQFSGYRRHTIYKICPDSSWTRAWDSPNDTTLTRTLIIINKDDSLSFLYRDNTFALGFNHLSFQNPIANSYHPDSLPGFNYFITTPSIYGHNMLRIAADSGVVTESKLWSNLKTHRVHSVLKLLDFTPSKDH